MLNGQKKFPVWLDLTQLKSPYCQSFNTCLIEKSHRKCFLIERNFFYCSLFINKKRKKLSTPKFFFIRYFPLERNKGTIFTLKRRERRKFESWKSSRQHVVLQKAKREIMFYGEHRHVEKNGSFWCYKCMYIIRKLFLNVIMCPSFSTFLRMKRKRQSRQQKVHIFFFFFFWYFVFFLFLHHLRHYFIPHKFLFKICWWGL